MNPILRAPSGVIALMLVGMGSGFSSAQIASLDKGHQLLVDRGIQLNGVVVLDADPFHLSTLYGAGFDAPEWGFGADNSKLGPAPGVPWGRWLDYTSENDLTPAEQPYKPNLTNISVGDEQNLNDSAVFNATVSWFNDNRSKFPGALLFTNQFGGETGDATLANFIAAANPDALSFDTYPYNPNQTTSVSPTNWYGDAQRYRRHGLGSSIGATGNAPRPYGLYLQTYASPSGTPSTRAPSDSEMRLQMFASWTMGFTFASAFTYNSGASTLFVNSSGGDNVPSAAYGQFAESARQSHNLSPALTRLISIGAGTRFVAGQNASGATNPLPISWLAWQPGSEGDLYTQSITAQNISATNGGHPGDVLVGYFHPLLESYDGPSFNNELYFMVTNGLTDPAALVADTKQIITMDFDFGASGINSLERLSRDTGLVETVPLADLTPGNTADGLYRLTLTLDGGTGDLFKFNDGAPFVGVPEPGSLALLGMAFLAQLRRKRPDGKAAIACTT